MTITHSSSFQRNIISTTILLCFTLLLQPCSSRINSLYDLDLSSQTLNPAATGFKVIGNAAGEYFGQSVSTAGDINKDGYDDIIIGAYYKNNKQGAVYVIYGGAESTMSNLDFSSGLTLDPLTTGFMITGNAADDLFGASVSTAGDINKDGYDDILVGAYGKNNFQGAAYVIYGGEKTSMSNIALSSTPLNPTLTGFMITGFTTNDNFGTSVSTAGDIDGDGFDDIIIGATGHNNYFGAAYVIYGGSTATRSNIVLSSTTLSPSSTGFKISQTGTGDRLGWSVSTAGDINNDGKDDIIIGAFCANNYGGAAYVVYGGPRPSMSDKSIPGSLSPTSTGFMITGNTAGDYLGYSVSTAGDIDGDGHDDIIVGAHEKNSAYVIYGGTTLTRSNIALTSSLNPTSTGFTITGSTASDKLGFAVSRAGDINNDGFGDIIVGTIGKNAAYVIYGGSRPTRSNIALSSQTLNPLTTGFMIAGNAAGDRFGQSLSRGGDINNDGYEDILVGAYGKNSNQGAAYVIYASCSAHCKQCSSEPVCTECQNSYLMYEYECFNPCPDTTFADTTTTCDDCSSHCKHCSSSSVCTECESLYLMYKSECFDICPEGTRANSPTTCEDCPTHCKHCSSSSVCTECFDSYRMYESECFDPCPDTTFADTATTCADCPLHCNHCTSPSLCTECLPPYVLYDSQCLTSCPKAMFNSNNVCKDCPSYCSSCTSEDSCQVCYPGFTLSSNSLCVAPGPSSSSYQEVQEKATQTISSSTRGISSIICVGSTVAPFAVLVAKTVQNTRYLNLSVTSDLSEIYQTWRTDLISWEVPNVFSNEDNFESSPPLFGQYDIDSPFLVNFWPTLLNIGIGSGTFIACILFQKLFELVKYKGWAHSLMQKFAAGSFNFTLVQAYACLDDILLYLVIDLKTNPLNSFFSWASMICAVIFLAFGCLQVLFNVWTVKKYQSIKNQGPKEIEAFNEKNQYWELFYSDFNDDDLWSQSFFALLIVRSTLSNLIIVLLSDNPLIQTLCLMTMDGLIILFLYVKTPFITLRGKLAQYYYEIITLLVHLCTFGLSLQESSEESSETIELIFSTGIIYLNTALISGSLGFMFIEIYKTISQRTKAAKLKQTKAQSEDTQEMQKLTNSLQPLETGDRKRPDWANQDQTAPSIDNSYLFPGGVKNGKMAIYDLNIEPSQTRELNLNNVDNSRDLDTGPALARRRIVRVPNQKQQGSNTIYPINN